MFWLWGRGSNCQVNEFVINRAQWLQPVITCHHENVGRNSHDIWHGGSVYTKKEPGSWALSEDTHSDIRRNTTNRLLHTPLRGKRAQMHEFIASLWWTLGKLVFYSFSKSANKRLGAPLQQQMDIKLSLKSEQGQWSDLQGWSHGSSVLQLLKCLPVFKNSSLNLLNLRATSNTVY